MTGLLRALIGLALVAAVTLAVQLALLSDAEFAPDHSLWIALDTIIAGGFVGVGLHAWYRRPENRVGMLMVATGFAWMLSVFARTEPALLFTAGLLASNLFVACAIHLLLAFPSGTVESRVDRFLVRASYGIIIAGFLVAIALYDPASNGCPECPRNLLEIGDDPSFLTGWFDLLDVLGLILLPAVIFRLAARRRAATPPLRRIVTPLFVAGALLLGMLAILLGLDLAGIEYAEGWYYAALIPFGLVPYLFLGSLFRAQLTRGGAVGELVASVGGPVPATELRAALARALNDPSLELAYWIPQTRSHVDADGRRVELPGAGDERACSEVRLDGRRVAALIHDPMLLDQPELIEAVGATAALALEKERLDAELRARIEELSDSRARMVAFGLAERRRLERDLHDGAQQRLVSLALDLRLARGAVRDDPERAEALLEGAAGELAEALEELRELARGIHPAVLSDRGLAPAVEALASRAPLPVEVRTSLFERVPEPIELAAYFVVSEALTNVVKYSSARAASVVVERDNGTLVVEVADDGVGGADPRLGSGLRGLDDRISALGGRLEVESDSGSGTRISATIPCG